MSSLRIPYRREQAPLSVWITRLPSTIPSLSMAGSWQAYVQGSLEGVYGPSDAADWFWSTKPSLAKGRLYQSICFRSFVTDRQAEVKNLNTAISTLPNKLINRSISMTKPRTDFPGQLAANEFNFPALIDLDPCSNRKSLRSESKDCFSDELLL